MNGMNEKKKNETKNDLWVFKQWHKYISLSHTVEVVIVVGSSRASSTTLDFQSLTSVFVPLRTTTVVSVKLKPSKWTDGPKSVAYLGHVISARRVYQ